MTKNRLSIIIPIFNEKERIIKLVDFLLKSDSQILLEILVVDAKKSTDNISDIKFPEKVRVIHSQETCRASQLQIGAEESRGDLLYFLHADTIPPSDYMMQIFNTLNQYDFAMFKYKFDRNQWNFRFNAWMTQWKAFYTGGGDQGLFLGKENFDKVGGFNSDLSIMEDYDLFWRLRKQKLSYKIVKSPATVSARKYMKNNALKVNTVNLITLLGFKMSGDAEKWTRFYKKYIK